MEILHRKKIVVLGMMSKMPVAGVVWQTAHYLVGLEKLGFDVYYVEAHARTPTTLMTSDQDNGTHLAVAFIEQACRRFGFEHRWAYHALHDDCRVYGMDESALSQLYKDAALIINLHGGTLPRPEHYATGRLLYLETDPVQVQIELAQNTDHTIRFLEPHCAFFTFGENYGRPDCRLPVSDRFEFLPTRQPVVLDFWDPLPPASPNAALTTIGNWEQVFREVEFNGETYHWSKHFEFLKFLDLPKRVEGRARFQLALSQYNGDVERMLREHGWDVRRAMDFSMDCDAYQQYIAGSLGEFTVAKDQNIRLRSGWFSDRSATYLAAGRPVITQDTAFDQILPTGNGLFSFATLDDAQHAVEAIRSDYEGQCRGAAAVAHDYFSHEAVLRPLLQHVGL